MLTTRAKCLEKCGYWREKYRRGVKAIVARCHAPLICAGLFTKWALTAAILLTSRGNLFPGVVAFQIRLIHKFIADAI